MFVVKDFGFLNEILEEILSLNHMPTQNHVLHEKIITWNELGGCDAEIRSKTLHKNLLWK